MEGGGGAGGRGGGSPDTAETGTATGALGTSCPPGGAGAGAGTGAGAGAEGRSVWGQAVARAAGGLGRGAGGKVQAVLTEVVRVPGGAPSLRRHALRCGRERIYPASCVKVAAAAAALNRLAGLRALAGAPDLSVWTGLVFSRTRDPAGAAAEASTSLGLLLRRVFLLSCNESHNLLLDFAGRAHANALLASAGVGVRLLGSLGEGRGPPRSPARHVEVLASGRPFSVRLDDPDGALEADTAGIGAPWTLGRAHVTPTGCLVEEPLQMGSKSCASLVALQDLLIRLLRPDLAGAEEEWLLDDAEAPTPGPALQAGPPEADGNFFGLDPRDAAFLFEAMAETCPGAPPLPGSEGLPEDYNKFFLRGLRASLGPHVSVRSKLGQAYGFSLDTAHVVWEDGPRGPREFFLAASVYTNANGVLNDDQYEYESEGEPLLEAVARAAGEIVQRTAGLTAPNGTS